MLKIGDLARAPRPGPRSSALLTLNPVLSFSSPLMQGRPSSWTSWNALGNSEKRRKAGTPGVSEGESAEPPLRSCRSKGGGGLDSRKGGTWSRADRTHPQLGAPIHAAPAEPAAAAAAAAPCPRRARSPPPAAERLSLKRRARPRPLQARTRPRRPCHTPICREAQNSALKAGPPKRRDPTDAPPPLKGKLPPAANGPLP